MSEFHVAPPRGEDDYEAYAQIACNAFVGTIERTRLWVSPERRKETLLVRRGDADASRALAAARRASRFALPLLAGRPPPFCPARSVNNPCR